MKRSQTLKKGISSLLFALALFSAMPRDSFAKEMRVSSEKALLKALKKKPNRLFLVFKKNGRVKLPKGNYQTEIIVRTKPSVKSCKLAVEKGAFLKSLILDTDTKIRLHIGGKLSYLSTIHEHGDLSLSLSKRTSEVAQLAIEAPTKLLLTDRPKSAKKSGVHILVKAKSVLSVTGKEREHPLLFLFQTAADSSVTADAPFTLFAEGNASALLKKGAEASALTALHYNTSLTVTNRTGEILSVLTPSGKKTVDANEERTVNGK